MTDAERAADNEAKIAIGMLESILIKVQKDMASDKSKNWGTVGDLKHLTAQLHDIEDQVYQSGEYART
jgi:hypothetical protein